MADIPPDLRGEIPFRLRAVPTDQILPHAADVVVIGGGIVGACTAYYLADRGVSVALVEKGIVGAEQSGRNWGWVRQQNRDERELPLARESLRLWGELKGQLADDTGFKQSGLIYVTDKAAELGTWERWARMAAEHGVPSQTLSAAEARQLVPSLAGDWIGGVTSPTDGRAEPGLAAPAIVEGARRRGATVHQRCAARGLETTGGAVSAVVTELGVIRTSTVICAAGAWASMFCRRLGISFPQAGAIGSVLVTEPAPELFTGGVSTPALTMRRRVDGAYTVSFRGQGRIEVTPQAMRYAREFWPMYKARRSKHVRIALGLSFLHGPESASRWSLDGISPFERMRVLNPKPEQSSIAAALAALREAYPSLARIGVAEQWGGWIDSTPDGVPVIGELAKPRGLFLASGFSGHGFGIGTGAGQLMADLVTGHTPIVDPSPYSFERFTAVKGGLRVAEM